MWKRAGFPIQTSLSGRSLVSTDPDPRTEFSPRVNPGLTVAPPPRTEPFFKTTFFQSDLLPDGGYLSFKIVLFVPRKVTSWISVRSST